MHLYNLVGKRQDVNYCLYITHITEIFMCHTNYGSIIYNIGLNVISILPKSNTLLKVSYFMQNKR